MGEKHSCFDIRSFVMQKNTDDDHLKIKNNEGKLRH